jgi:release factor glutamine methyltransferase
LNLVEYLQRATAYLERHEVPSPRYNAELLLSNLIGVSRLDIYTGFERVLTQGESDAYRAMLVERADGRPLQYITGEAGFRGLTLEVRPGVFIPRPETEVLVERALEFLPDDDAPSEVLDLCCGCGNVAISVANERPESRIQAVDCEKGAVELTARNASRCGVGSRIEVHRGDLFEPFKQTGAAFDLIISNPPYVPSGCRDTLPLEVREFEPPHALFAGEDGLDVIRRIVDEAPDYLKQGGCLLLEVDESHAEKVISELLGKSFPSAPGGEVRGKGGTQATWSDTELFKDLAGRPRVVSARVVLDGR